MFGSLAASIMGGLLFGTLITLLFIPILYALFLCTDDSNKVERLSGQQHYSYHTDKYQRNRAEDDR